jgi:quercetin dioxygenase-like cupin family protein
MRPFDLGTVLPEFAAEHASAPDAAAEAELAALLSELSLVALDGADALSTSDLDHGRARLLSEVTQGAERFAPFFGKLTKFFDLSVDALRAVFQRAERESEWQPGPLPWVSLFHLEGGPAVAGLDTGFVRLKKGMPFPPHRHKGSERVIILEGGYYDHEGRFYGPGDAHDMSEGTQHALQMVADRDVLLAVIMTDQIEVIGAP